MLEDRLNAERTTPAMNILLRIVRYQNVSHQLRVNLIFHPSVLELLESKPRNSRVSVCVGCSCASGVLTRAAHHLFCGRGRCAVTGGRARGPPPRDCTPVHCTTDVLGGWSGRLESVLRSGCTQRVTDTHVTHGALCYASLVVCHCGKSSQYSILALLLPS